MSPAIRIHRLSTIGVIFILGIILMGNHPAYSADSELMKITTSEPQSLERLLGAARTHNPDLLKAKSQLSVNQMLKLNAIGSFLPSFSVGYQISQNNYYNPTYTNPDGTVSSYPYTITEPSFYVDSLGYYRQGGTQTVTYEVPEGKRRNSNLYLSLSTTWNLGGQQILGVRNAKKYTEINQSNLESTTQQVEGGIRQQYYQVLAMQKLLELAKEVLSRSQDQLELATARFQTGSVTELDVLQAQIDVGNEQNNVLTAEHNLQMAREELNRLIGIDLSSEYPLVDEFRVFPPEFTLEDLVKKAMTDRPDLKSSELSSEISKNNVQMSWGDYMPDLTGSISHSRSEQSGSNVGWTLNPRNRSTQYSLGLSWTLFSGFSREKALQESKVAYRQAELDKVALKQSIEKSVREAYYTLIRIWDQSKVTQQNKDLATRQLDLERERYRLGAATQLELRSAQVTLTQAETNDISNTLEYLINFVLLEEAVGGKLH
jgi:outer membrane protein